MKIYSSTLIGFTSLTVVAGSAAQALFSKSFQLLIAHTLHNAGIAHPTDPLNVALCLAVTLAPLAIMAVMMLLPQLMEVPSQGLGSIKREDFAKASELVSQPARGSIGKKQRSLQATRNGRMELGKLGMRTQLTFRPAPLMVRSTV
jgi:hypothetical protein